MRISISTRKLSDGRMRVTAHDRGGLVIQYAVLPPRTPKEDVMRARETVRMLAEIKEEARRADKS